MASQLSKKAALPLAKILVTCRNNVSNTGPWNHAVSGLRNSFEKLLVKSTGARSPNTFQWLNSKTPYQDCSPSNGRQGNVRYHMCRYSVQDKDIRCTRGLMIIDIPHFRPGNRFGVYTTVYIHVICFQIPGWWDIKSFHMRSVAISTIALYVICFLWQTSMCRKTTSWVIKQMLILQMRMMYHSSTG